MSTPLTIDQIDEAYKGKVYTQDYGSKDTIDGVKEVAIRSMVSEDGNFSELLRITPTGTLELFPDFQLAQINRSELQGKSIKAWHLHFKQNEIWYVNPTSQLLVGLLDVRNDSPTNGKTMRIVLGGGKSTLLFIPNGVAHGSINLLPESAVIWYFIDTQFDIHAPDEQRLHWDILGADFWQPVRD